MEFTAEQLEILRKGFQQHDITKGVDLFKKNKVPKERTEAFQLLKDLTTGFMKGDLRELGIKRDMGNFSGDHPVNLLMNTDAQVIAGEGAEIMCDQEKKVAAINQFFDTFGPLIDTARDYYCRTREKKPKELTNEDWQIIMDRVVKVVNETLLSAVLQGQQIKEIYDISHHEPAHEDYPDQLNPDSINFFNKWTHSQTKLGALLSLDGEMEMGDIADENWAEEEMPEVTGKSRAEEEREYQQLREAFMDKLDGVELEIFFLREDGKTQKEIAKELGYATHSAVTKKLIKMRKKFNELLSEES